MSDSDFPTMTVLIVLTTLLAFFGLVASFMENWYLSTACWAAAFLFKWVECWLLERAFVTAQLALEANP